MPGSSISLSTTFVIRGHRGLLRWAFPEHVRRDILGHSSTSMTGDYTHASPEEMERAMELVASYKEQRGSKLGKNLGKISAKQKTAADLKSAVGL